MLQNKHNTLTNNFTANESHKKCTAIINLLKPNKYVYAYVCVGKQGKMAIVTRKRTFHEKEYIRNVFAKKIN